MKTIQMIQLILVLLFLILALLLAAAQAEELQFDLTGTAYTPDNPYYPGVGPIDISFQLDTQSGTQSFLYAEGCLQHFDVSGASLSSINVQLNGHPSTFAANSTINFGGDNANGSCTQGIFVAALQFSTPDISGWWEFDPGLSQPNLKASNDPIADLFLGFQQYSSSAVVTTSSGVYDLDFKHVSVTSVPEPGFLALFLLGLTGIAISRWRDLS